MQGEEKKADVPNSDIAEFIEKIKSRSDVSEEVKILLNELEMRSRGFCAIEKNYMAEIRFPAKYLKSVYEYLKSLK